MEHAVTESHRHVFISYRRSDTAVVEDLVQALGEAYPSWRDTPRIRGGQQWREQIVRAIDAAYALILVVGADTERSKEVYAEHFYALGRGIPVVPLLVADCALPFGLDNVQARSWHRDREKTLHELRRDLDHHRAQAPAAEALSAEHAFLQALKLDYLLHVENYTRMAGVARRRFRGAGVRPQAVVMRPEFALRRSGPLFEGREPAEEQRSYEDLLPALHELGRVLILGEPGIGKTTNLYKFADELRIRALDSPRAPLPVIVPLREWRGDVPWARFVADHLGGLADRYRPLLGVGRLTLLLDGLNEIPRDVHRPGKLKDLRRLLKEGHPAVVTCRELDYRDSTLHLALDTITIRPLDPERVHEFLGTYLMNALGEAEGARQADELFWQIAGGEDVKGLWEKWRDAGAGLNLFFQAPDIPQQSPDVYRVTSGEEDRRWMERVRTPGNLVHLAANPYLLWMFLNVYLELGAVPANRGALFDEFLFQLLKREGLTEADGFNENGQALTEALGELAWQLQRQAAAASDPGGGVELALPRQEVVEILGAEAHLYRAASASVLEDADPARFTHQLLQEYFAASRLVVEIDRGLAARELWDPTRWWQPSGWEEVSVLAAGMQPRTVLTWVQDANPEVAARCAKDSGALVLDDTLIAWRGAWLPRLTDAERDPAPEARAAIGRALGSLTLADDAPLDNRLGVSVRREETSGRWLPDLDWVEVPEGEFTYQEGERRHLPTFHIARYPVTNAQFKAFLDDEGGYPNSDWWTDLERSDAPAEPGWRYPNHLRETVSWCDAIAFCRWFSARSGYEISLPTEQQWEKAARGTDGRMYPWGGTAYRSGYANINETWGGAGEHKLDQTSAVGIYPQGASPYGVLDLSGGVWEWCLNKFDKPEVVSVDASGDWRALRGGSWRYDQVNARADYRYNSRPVNRNINIGFRVCCASPHL